MFFTSYTTYLYTQHFAQRLSSPHSEKQAISCNVLFFTRHFGAFWENFYLEVSWFMWVSKTYKAYISSGKRESKFSWVFNSLMGKGAFEHHFITYLNGQRRICAPLLLCYHPAATLQASKVISILWLVEVFPFMNNFSWLFNCESRVYQTRSRLVTLYQYL